MRVGNVFQKFAESGVGQKFYKAVCDPKNQKFMNQKLPLIESLFSGVLYVASTEMQRKKIPNKERKAMQIQNVCSTGLGMALSGVLNRGMDGVANKIIPHLNEARIEDIHKIKGGLKVCMPILATMFVMRFVAPTILVPISTFVRDKFSKPKQGDTFIKSGGKIASK